MSASGRIAAIAFDLDGTLIDTAPDIGVALNTALAGAGLATVDLARVRSWIGDGPERLIRHALADLGVAADEPLVARLHDAFSRATLAVPHSLGRVYDGIEALLARWHGRMPMVVVTNKPSALSRSVVGAAGLLPRFATVHGADHAAQRKPAPALLLAAAAGCGVAPAQLLMVGDSHNDLRAAHAAGCPAAWVAWGYGAAPAPGEPAVPRIDHADALDRLITHHPAFA